VGGDQDRATRTGQPPDEAAHLAHALGASPVLVHADAVGHLVEEAGGRLTDFSGTPTIYGGSVLATNGHLHEPALRALAGGR